MRVLHFFVLLQKSAAQTITMLQQACGERVIKDSQLYDWHKRFHDGRESAEDHQRGGQPSTSTNETNFERVLELLSNVYSCTRGLF